MSENSRSFSEQYEIYPVPHSVIYSKGVVLLDKEIQVTYDDTIDDVTKKKVEKVLKENSLPFSVSTELTAGELHLLVGTKGSNGPVDQYAAKQLSSKDFDFEKNDAHLLQIQDQTITILGKDTDASFYGVVTLENILAQLTDHTLRSVSIYDYSNTRVRGVIEGYYGIPWSNEDRISLMEFGGRFKANTFVFAPKDDPYHREKWGELYPKEMLDELGKLAQVGNETKNRFVWTISPLGEVAQLARREGQEAVMAMLEENTEKMLHKFDQLYDVGVRQFGVLGDDVGNLPLDYVVQLMDSVSTWVKEKGDVYDTLYCPASYNSAWAWIPAELNAYEKGFDKNIHIFWTGSTTCAPVVQSTIDVFKNKENDGLVRRDPLFWLNWPVNDVDMSRVFLGKGEMLETNIKNLAGVVTNPMQEAEASKISIFAIADYAWNTEGFNDQKSWEDSFKYIEPDATEELYVLAKHMSDAHPNGIRLSESEDIKELLNDVTEKVVNGLSIKEDADEVISELSQIATMADQFLVKTKNDKLKEELTPFAQSLRELVLADIEFIKAKLATEVENKAEAWNKFAEGLSLRGQSNNYDRPMLIGTKKTKPAQKRLQPFTETLEEKVSQKVADLIGIEEPVQKATLFTNAEKYKELAVAEEVGNTLIVDGGNISLAGNEYIGLKLSRVKEVIAIETPSVEGLSLEASLNGIEWSQVDNQYHGTARYIRLQNSGSSAIDFALNSFKVISHEIQPKSVKNTNYEDHENLLALFDGDLSTNAYFRAGQKAGKYVTYDLGQEIAINNLKIYVGEAEHDFPRHAILETSLDGEQWTTVMELGKQDGPNPGEATDGDRIDAIFDQLVVPYRIKEAENVNVQARYLRFRVTMDKVGAEKWIRLHEIMINDGKYYPELNDPTVITDSTVNTGYEIHHINDGKLTTSFKPGNREKGYVLYHIGEIEYNITGITILEDPRNLSGSTVSVRTPNGWTHIGKMESAYQFFNTGAVSDILDLKIEWDEGKVPTIYEVKLDREVK
ncbi:beta-N-acetylglucosaminidase domain-containing protein [Bacillus niameyensis]|uniref:beta-N-acetylglucosaminidase domain-containing protein n=1 Tax=Bacillus niameyensis TaxID=1522308 RepID=UPI0007819663|nr:beta-N-acetylglucosaminidase domain-containing protein [Bacillus niameyensis]